MKNSFKVYNGPLPLPPCEICGQAICDWMSTIYCEYHALEAVKEYDRKVKAEQSEL